MNSPELSKSEFGELEGLIDTFNKNELRFKEVRIKVNFPFKKVCDFIVVKQVILSFKIGNNIFSPYKLYIQHLVTTEDQSTSRNVRILWSKNGKFLPDSDTKVNPSIMSLILKLGEVFGLYSTSIDLSFPFPIKLSGDPVKQEDIEDSM